MARRIEIIGGHVGKNGDNTSLIPTHGTGLGVNTSPNSFAYTLDNDVLSHEQRQFYEDNGFIVIRNLVPLEKLQVYKDYFRALCEKKVKSGMTMMRDVAIAKTEFSATEKAITKIQDFVFDDVLFEYCCLPEVLRYVKCFTGPNVRAIHTMLINKPPDPGTMTSRHPMHQDLQYFPIRPANRIVCAWTAMERVNRANGCLVAVPGTHKGELLEHDYPEWEGGVNVLYHGIKDYKPNDNDRVWLEMEAGDTVFFHPILHHGSGANRTEGFRKAISCHYAACECHYIDVKGTVQEHLAKEITEVAKKMALKKYGVEGAEFTIQDIWRGKSRLACGHEVNL